MTTPEPRIIPIDDETIYSVQIPTAAGELTITLKLPEKEVEA